MLLTAEQAAARLNSPDNLLNKVERANSNFVIKQINHGGRSNGDKNLSHEDRVLIGTIASVGSAVEVAKDFGISRQHVENIKYGRTGARAGREKSHPELKAAIQAKKDEVRDVALEKLMQSMGLMDEEKLTDCDAKDLSSIAANMSKVVEQMSPKDAVNNGVQVVIYAPPTKKIDDFQVIEI